MKNKINILCGTTASGKTKLAIDLAKEINAEIVNADSMQVYTEIPILTAQPTIEERQDIPHHLYGVISCANNINVARWVELAMGKIREIMTRGKTPLLVGGTGMYIKSLVYGLSYIPPIPNDIQAKVKELALETAGKGHKLHQILASMDPKAAERLQANDKHRIMRALEVVMATQKSLLEWQQEKQQTWFQRESFYIMLLSRPREIIYQNINQRFLNMLDNGALEEARNVLQMFGGIGINLPKAHGLPELTQYLKNEIGISLEAAISKSQQNVRNYAKRQITWFKHQLDFDKEFIL